MRVPSSTPAGTLTESVRSLVTRPAPEHLSHGFSIVCPRPLQEGQVRSMAKKPCCARTRPWPPQVLQVTGLEPARAPEPAQASQATEVEIGRASCRERV